MQVLNIVDQTTRQIILDLIDYDRRSNIDQLDISVLLFIIIDRFIGLLIIANAFAEVQRRQLRVLPLIIRRISLDFKDIGHDEIFIVTNRFDKERFDIGITALLEDPLATLFGRVRSVQNSNHSFLCIVMEPVDHIGDGHFGGGSTHSLTFFIVRIEEGGLGLGGVATTIGTDVEDLGGDSNPGEIPHC